MITKEILPRFLSPTLLSLFCYLCSFQSHNWFPLIPPTSEGIILFEAPPQGHSPFFSLHYVFGVFTTLHDVAPAQIIFFSPNRLSNPIIL